MGVRADVLAGARLLAQLPTFLRRPVSLAEARMALRARRDTREATFLDLVRRAVYGRPSSPYARLLRHAGCAYGDLERLVGAEGIEGALGRLLRAGVHLTVDEMRGTRPVRRGSLEISVGAERLQNPLVGVDLPVQTGGSRSAGTRVGWSLAFVRDRAVDLALAEAARGTVARRYAVWAAPGSAAIAHLLDIAARGPTPDRWFSPVDPAAPALPARYRVGTHVLRGAGWLAGRRLPLPRHVPVLAPGPIVDWVAAGRAPGPTPYLHARPSAVLRLCEAAAGRGVDLSGLEAVVGGEPITAVRAAAMRRAGIRVLPRYAAVEVGLIGDACLAPRGADDVHVLDDLVAVVQAAGDEGAGTPAGALHVSSLRPTAPLVVLNASMGDTAVLEPARCDCPMAALGWTTSLRYIVSYDKLTGQGVTFHDTDVVRILDEVLPARFGGGPGDYQLVESEGSDGRPRLELRVHPGVGPIDPWALSETFLATLGAGRGSAGIMREIWRDAGLLTVSRQPPLATGAGKVLHLHRRRPSDDRAG